jgi:DNA polymerase I-like protein with 3'-5' exonuclease and polymerase domains
MSNSPKSNLLASPKRKDFWAAFIPPDGYVLANFDYEALEPKVLAHMSQDPNMLRLHGKDSTENHDGYLFVAYDSSPRVREIYHRDKPGGLTKEEVANAKKILKVERNDIKPEYLGWIFGLGPETLSMSKNIPFFEAKRRLELIDKTFPGKDMLAATLKREWVARNGYVIDGRGLPCTIHYKDLRKLLNKVIQKTGHAILQRGNWWMDKYIKEHKIDCFPYIPDLHDEGSWVVRKGEEESFALAVEHHFDMVNSELDWTVEMRHGGISFGDNLGIRCE